MGIHHTSLNLLVATSELDMYLLRVVDTAAIMHAKPAMSFPFCPFYFRDIHKRVLEDLVSRTNKSQRTVHYSLYLISLVSIHIILAIFNFQINVIDFLRLKDVTV